ncbi:MAG: metallophosphoesterase family protein [Chloroflexia bacterium]
MPASRRAGTITSVPKGFRTLRIGVISDMHGNFVALRTVLEDMGSVDALWCLGDFVGYGPQPNECIETVSQFPHLGIPGNHDWGMLGRLNLEEFNHDARVVIEWTRKVITPANLEFLESLPIAVTPEEPSVTMVHASPRDPMWEYLLDLFDAAECFPLFSTRYLFVGHTHVPLIFRDSRGIVKAAIPEESEKMRLNVRIMGAKEDPQAGGARMIINPGSVGQPRDGDPRAAYMVLDLPDEPPSGPWNATLSFRRIRYPIEETQAIMKDLKFPPRLISRLEVGV